MLHKLLVCSKCTKHLEKGSYVCEYHVNILNERALLFGFLNISMPICSM